MVKQVLLKDSIFSNIKSEEVEKFQRLAEKAVTLGDYKEFNAAYDINLKKCPCGGPECDSFSYVTPADGEMSNINKAWPEIKDLIKSIKPSTPDKVFCGGINQFLITSVLYGANSLILQDEGDPAGKVLVISEGFGGKYIRIRSNEKGGIDFRSTQSKSICCPEEAEINPQDYYKNRGTLFQLAVLIESRLNPSMRKNYS